MILEPTIKTAASGNNYNEILNNSPFWVCVYNGDQIVFVTPEADPIISTNIISGYTMFGSNNYSDLLAEIANRNLNQ